MGAPELLARLRAGGLSLTATGEKLVVSPRELLTPELRSLIRANKPALLLAVTAAGMRRQRVLDMVNANSELTYSLTADMDADLDVVLMTLAIYGKATCEFELSRDKYDPFLLLDLLERHGRRHH